MGYRHKAREAALQLLYSLEFVDELTPENILDFWQLINKSSPGLKAFTMQIFKGVTENRPKIDDILQKASLHWRMDRMSLIDKNILRIAIFELLFMDDIPFKVSIDEAIEMGKKFGAKNSGSFINGILDRVASNMQKGQ